jgi:hypothetical protein
MELQIGDRLVVDETSRYEVASRPQLTADGTSAQLLGAQSLCDRTAIRPGA